MLSSENPTHLISLDLQELCGPGMRVLLLQLGTQAQGDEGGPAPRPGVTSAEAPAAPGPWAGWALKRPFRDETSSGLGKNRIS